MNDLIRRQDAIEYFMTNTNWHDEEGYPIEDAEDKRALLTDYFNSIPSAQQWIPCSERLPKRENEYQRRCTYLVTNAYGNVYVMKYEFCGDFGFVGWGTNRPHDIRIIAWMPFPEPYIESEVES